MKTTKEEAELIIEMLEHDIKVNKQLIDDSKFYEHAEGAKKLFSEDIETKERIKQHLIEDFGI